MQDFPYILTEYEEINAILHKPVSSTQRIKYTCFNVSTNYILLGSTSGSIYLFSRKPCVFLQLIPLTEGAVSRISISPDEKTIALSTARGTVCLVALKPNAKLIAVSMEHVSEQINCFCWNDNSSEVYIGDGAGKVSVMTLSFFTVNGMFQAPECMLMNLDSSIVQLCYCTPLLLVSTLTRCYICDTVQEQYKQIGNKARSGEFGACFFKPHTREEKRVSAHRADEKTVRAKNSFSFIPENDSNIAEENSLRMFCARPGSRLWEVSANGTVIKTHQFKDVLAIPPLQIYNRDAPKHKLNKKVDEIWTAQSVNFSHLLVIAEKYLFSYTTNGLYILDPRNATVVLWNNEYTNIATAEVTENKIYLMTCDSKFHCLTLRSIDSLILHLYNNKQYYDCLAACRLYKSQLLKSPVGEEIKEICDNPENLEALKNVEISTMLQSLISALRSNVNIHPIKLDTGIVVVNSGNLNAKCDVKLYSSAVTDNMLATREQRYSRNSCEITTESSEDDPPIVTTTTNSVDNINYTKNPSLGSKMDTQNSTADCEESNRNEDAMRGVQNDLEPVYKLIDSIKPTMTEEETKKVILDIEQRLKDIKDSYKSLHELRHFIYEVIRMAELYYFNTFLENTSVHLLSSTNNDCIVEQFLRTFVEVNAQSTKCSCNVPCPTQLKEPKFLAIGRALLRKLIDEDPERCVYLCTKVPFMWREFLLDYNNRQYPLSNILRQCLHTKDAIVFSTLLPLLNTQLWRATIMYLKQMDEGKCLFCGNVNRDVDKKDLLIDWSSVIREVMKRDGPDAAVAFLAKLESIVPRLSFDKSIFQSLVFTKILNHHGIKCTVDFKKSSPEAIEYSTMCSSEVRDQLINVLEKDLGRPINKNIFGTGAHHWGMRCQSKSLTCPCCTLSLQTPILLGNKGIAIFSCGHAYHVNCMIEKKLTKCNLHV